MATGRHGGRGRGQAALANAAGIMTAIRVMTKISSLCGSRRKSAVACFEPARTCGADIGTSGLLNLRSQIVLPAA
jgi:hypothetical protein